MSTHIKKILPIMFLLLCFIYLPCAQAEERITLSTYYPAPYGEYDDLTAYDLTAYNMKVGVTYSDPDVIIDDNNLIVEGNIGIGTTAPGEKLEVSGNIRLTTDNDKIQLGTAQDISTSYNGTNWLFNPKVVGTGVMLADTDSKWSFRDTAIGIYSQADTFFDLFADGAVRIGDSSAGAPTNYTKFGADGSISQVGTARIDWTKYTANSVTVAGFTAVGQVVADLQTANDGAVFTLTEVAGGGNYIIVDFVSVTAFNWVKVLGSYSGSGTHGIYIELWDWTGTPAWKQFDCMQDAFTDSGALYCNHDFFVPSDTNFVGTGDDAGKVRVRFNHSATTVNNHILYLDEVSLQQ